MGLVDVTEPHRHFGRNKYEADEMVTEFLDYKLDFDELTKWRNRPSLIAASASIERILSVANDGNQAFLVSLQAHRDAIRYSNISDACKALYDFKDMRRPSRSIDLVDSKPSTFSRDQWVKELDMLEAACASAYNDMERDVERWTAHEDAEASLRHIDRQYKSLRNSVCSVAKLISHLIPYSLFGLAFSLYCLIEAHSDGSSPDAELYLTCICAIVAVLLVCALFINHKLRSISPGSDSSIVSIYSGCDFSHDHAVSMIRRCFWVQLSRGESVDTQH